MVQVKEFSPNDRFLSITVYKFPLGNCGGITDHKGTIYIPCSEGPYKFSELKDRLELIFIPEQRGPEYWALKPLLQPTNMIGPMSGGNLAYCSDSRCKHIYHIHDRFETQQVYDMLST